jgi:hypothetical protein
LLEYALLNLCKDTHGTIWGWEWELRLGRHIGRETLPYVPLFLLIFKLFLFLLFFVLFCEVSLMFPRLGSNFWAEVILLPQLPK